MKIKIIFGKIGKDTEKLLIGFQMLFQENVLEAVGKFRKNLKENPWELLKFWNNFRGISQKT